MTGTDDGTPDEAAALARRLKQAREFLNLSQQFVAEQTGISRTAVSDIERGARRVESLELKRLARLYRMPVDYFLGGGSVEGAADATSTALARAAGDLDEEAQEEVIRFALFLRNYRTPGEGGS